MGKTGLPSKIERWNLEDICLDYEQRGYSYAKITRILNETHIPKGESISQMAVHRWLVSRQKRWETQLWEGEYKKATLAYQDEASQSLNKLYRELENLFEMLFREKSIRKSDKIYLNRHLREYKNRLHRCMMNMGMIHNIIDFKQGEMRQFMIGFANILDRSERERLAKYIEENTKQGNERYKELCEKRKCFNDVYEYNSEEDLDDEYESEEGETS